QGLPVGPTGFGDSPYSALSAVAGNGLLISPDLLVEDQLLAARHIEGQDFPPETVDYDAVAAFKVGLLHIAWRRFNGGARPDLAGPFGGVCAARARWLGELA